MKQINLKNAQIEEIIIRPHENIPVSVSYKLLDDAGNVVTVKRANIPANEITKTMGDMADKLLACINEDEGLK